MRTFIPHLSFHRLPSTLLRVAAAAAGITATSPSLAHPGHGLGSLGHDTQHALWNFVGFVLIGATLLIVRHLEKNEKQ